MKLCDCQSRTVKLCDCQSRTVKLCDCQSRTVKLCDCKFVGLARTIYIYSVCTTFSAGKLPSIRSCTVHMYGPGRPCTFAVKARALCVFGVCTKLTPWAFPKCTPFRPKLTHFLKTPGEGPCRYTLCLLLAFSSGRAGHQSVLALGFVNRCASSSCFTVGSQAVL